MEREGKIRADDSLEPARTLYQYLGQYIAVQYACHTKWAMLVECGYGWGLFSDGGMVAENAITSISTTKPKEERKAKTSLLPDDLGDLFK